MVTQCGGGRKGRYGDGAVGPAPPFPVPLASRYGRFMISQWLGVHAWEDFLHDHYGKTPFAQPHVARCALPLLTWDTLYRILPSCRHDALLVRNGTLCETAFPRCPQEFRRLFESGHSIVIRRAENHDAGLAQLAGTVDGQYPGEVTIHIFVTPAGHHSFGWHYDCEDVFLVQTAGVKEYLLRENTVNPRPPRQPCPRTCTMSAKPAPWRPAPWSREIGSIFHGDGGMWPAAPRTRCRCPWVYFGRKSRETFGGEHRDHQPPSTKASVADLELLAAVAVTGIVAAQLGPGIAYRFLTGTMVMVVAAVFAMLVVMVVKIVFSAHGVGPWKAKLQCSRKIANAPLVSEGGTSAWQRVY